MALPNKPPVLPDPVRKNTKKKPSKANNKGQSLLDKAAKAARKPLIPNPPITPAKVGAKAVPVVESVKGSAAFFSNINKFFSAKENWPKRALWFAIGFSLLLFAFVRFTTESKAAKEVVSTVAGTTITGQEAKLAAAAATRAKAAKTAAAATKAQKAASTKIAAGKSTT